MKSSSETRHVNYMHSAALLKVCKLFGIRELYTFKIILNIISLYPNLDKKYILDLPWRTLNANTGNLLVHKSLLSLFNLFRLLFYGAATYQKIILTAILTALKVSCVPGGTGGTIDSNKKQLYQLWSSITQWNNYYYLLFTLEYLWFQNLHIMFELGSYLLCGLWLISTSVRLFALRLEWNQTHAIGSIEWTLDWDLGCSLTIIRLPI